MSMPFVYSFNSSSVALHVQSYVYKLFCTSEAHLRANDKWKPSIVKIIANQGWWEDGSAVDSFL